MQAKFAEMEEEQAFLKKFNLASEKVMSISLAINFNFCVASCPIDDIEKGMISKILYDNTMGSLMYVVVCTRPDVAHVVHMWDW